MALTEQAMAVEVELAPKRAAQMIADGAELIDTRRDYEWEGGRIPGARHIEINELTGAADDLPRDRPLVFYCRSGSRSRFAADAFRTAGFEAYNLAGGIRAWVDVGFAIDPPGGEVRDPLPAS